MARKDVRTLVPLACDVYVFLTGVSYLGVSIEVIAAFKRMQKITRDLTMVVCALRQSAVLQVLLGYFTIVCCFGVVITFVCSR